LERRLDWDNKEERDLIEIAQYLTEWEEVLRAPLGLKPTDVNDIKAKHQNNPKLQR
jgi:hypothetical protein